MNRRTVCVALMSLAAIVLCGQVISAGDDEKKETTAPKPGPEHKLLKKLAGNWDAKIKAWFGPGEPKESAGMLNRSIIMQGLFAQEKFKGEFLGAKFQGLGIMGYDTNKKKYVMAWVDNFTTSISLNYGSYDAGAKTLTFVGEEDNPALGGKVKTRDVLKMVSDDEHLFEMYRTPIAAGKEMKVMEVTYTRVTKKKE